MRCVYLLWIAIMAQAFAPAVLAVENTKSDPIEQLDPAFSGKFDVMYQEVWGEGKIPERYKHLSGVSISVVQQCEPCLAFHIKSAVAAGANRDQLVEALRLGLLTGGSITIPTLREGAKLILQMNIAPLAEQGM